MITCILELLTGSGQGSYRTFVKYSGMVFNSRFPGHSPSWGPGCMNLNKLPEWLLCRRKFDSPGVTPLKPGLRTGEERIVWKVLPHLIPKGFKAVTGGQESVYPLRLVKSIWASLIILQHFSLLSCDLLVTSSFLFARYFSLALLTKLITSPPTNHSQWVLPFCSQNLFSQICT